MINICIFTLTVYVIAGNLHVHYWRVQGIRSLIYFVAWPLAISKYWPDSMRYREGYRTAVLRFEKYDIESAKRTMEFMSHYSPSDWMLGYVDAIKDLEKWKVLK